MRRLIVLSYKKDTRTLIRKLMQLRCVEIQSTDLCGGGYELDRPAVSADVERAEKRLCAISEAQRTLLACGKRKRGLLGRKRAVDMAEFITGERYGRAQAAVKETEIAARELDGLCKKEGEARALLASLLPFKAYPRPLGLHGTEHTDIILGSLPAGCDYSAFLGVIEGFYAMSERVLFKEGAESFVCVICHKSDTVALLEAVAALGFSKIEFPDSFLRAGREIERVEEELRELGAKIAQTKAELARLSSRLDDIDVLYDVEATALKTVLIHSDLGCTEHIDVLCGWVPERDMKRVCLCLESFDAAYELSKPQDWNNIPPVLLTGVAGKLARVGFLRRIGLFNRYYKDGAKPFRAAVPSEKYTVEK